MPIRAPRSCARPALALSLLALGAVACGASSSETTSKSVDLALGGASLPFRGTTLSGAEFGAQNVPGTFGTDYTYPTNAEVDYFLGKGMTSLRVPFLWERMQHAAKTDLDPTELGRLDAFVTYATGRGATVVLDPHNYARYYGQVVGAGVGDDAFADFWSRMATHYKANGRTVFALMNEPHDLPTEQWEGAAQAAINAIRAAGATNLILVPGNEWTGAHSWDQNFYGTPNSQVMLEITDSGNNYAFEVHQYLDSDFSGTSATCVSTTIGSESMKDFAAWLHANGKRGFLGEFGGGYNPTCVSAVNDQLAFVEANDDVFLGWSWWSAGPWWGSYFLSIEPSNGQDAPMMSVLETHLKFTSSAPVANPPAPPVVSSPSPAPTPSPHGSDGLTTTMTITSDWQTGYCADIHVHNAGAETVNGWTLTLNASAGSLTQAWNVTATQSGTTYTFTPVSWNAPIGAASDANFGFCANEGSSGAKAYVLSVQ